VFGIKFPVGLPPGERKVPLTESSDGPEPGNLPTVSMTDMEILREKEPPQELPVAQAEGIEVKAVPTSGQIVYELKIPLAPTKEHPLAVGTEPGRTIGVGFESPRPELGQMPRRSPKDRSQAGGEPGREGGEPGQEGGEPGEEGGEQGQQGMGGYGRQSPTPEAMRLWAFVSLVREQGGGQAAHQLLSQ